MKNKTKVYEKNGKWYVKINGSTLGPFDSYDEAIEFVEDEI